MAKLHKISTEEVDSYVDQCHKKYGNLLTSEQQRNYIRAAIEADHPFQYFQFTGKVFKDGRRNIYLPEIPIWFQHYNTNLDKCVISESRIVYDDFGECVHVRGYIYFKNSRKRTCIEDDYMVDIRPFGIMSVPKSVFENCYEKDEIALYKYCQDQYDLSMDW